MCEDFMSERESIGTPRTCRVCGCTDHDCRQCIEAQGHPCYWVEDDLCSRCATGLGMELVDDGLADLSYIQKSIGQLHPDDLTLVKVNAEHLRKFIANGGVPALLAYALVGAEISAAE